MGKLQELTGQKFGHLTVIAKGKESKYRDTTWVVQCVCGGVKTVLRSSLVKLQGLENRSCGCKKKNNLKHGMSNSRLYYVWNNMLRRCYDTNNRAYNRYGGRGIRVCERWHTFENFAEDTASSYKHGLSLDRIDNSKGYCKENCRWATSKEQNLNRGDNIKVNGLNSDEISRLYGISKSTLSARKARGWTGEKLLSPVRKWPKKQV